MLSSTKHTSADKTGSSQFRSLPVFVLGYNIKLGVVAKGCIIIVIAAGVVG